MHITNPQSAYCCYLSEFSADMFSITRDQHECFQRAYILFLGSDDKVGTDTTLRQNASNNKASERDQLVVYLTLVREVGVKATARFTRSVDKLARACLHVSAVCTTLMVFWVCCL